MNRIDQFYETLDIIEPTALLKRPKGRFFTEIITNSGVELTSWKVTRIYSTWIENIICDER